MPVDKAAELLSGYSTPSSSSDEEGEDDGELEDGFGGRKSLKRKRKGSGKDWATYGVFAEEEGEGGYSGTRHAKGGKRKDVRRGDLLKPQMFVPAGGSGSSSENRTPTEGLDIPDFQPSTSRRTKSDEGASSEEDGGEEPDEEGARKSEEDEDELAPLREGGEFVPSTFVSSRDNRMRDRDADEGVDDDDDGVEERGKGGIGAGRGGIGSGGRGGGGGGGLGFSRGGLGSGLGRGRGGRGGLGSGGRGMMSSFRRSSTASSETSTPKGFETPPSESVLPGPTTSSFAPATSASEAVGGSAGVGASNEDDAGLPAAAEESSAETTARVRRSFLGSGEPTTGTGIGMQKKPLAAMSAAEKKHFAGLEKKGGIGLKLMQKMGYVAGTGLGLQNEGRVTPIETKLRPKTMGLAYDGFGERSKQNKIEEARQRGDIVPELEEEAAEDEETGRGRKGRKGKKVGFGQDAPLVGREEKRDRGDAWKKKRERTKVEHRTYEEIVAQSGGDGTSAGQGIGPIVDLTGASLPSLPSTLSSAALVGIPTGDETRLPELRHNLRLIVDSTRADVDNLAREARGLGERQRWVDGEGIKVGKRTSDGKKRIQKLKEIQEIVKRMEQISREADPEEFMVPKSFEVFDPLVDTLTGLYPDEFAEYSLDEVVVGAIAQSLRRAWMTWDPLREPAKFVNELKKWKEAFRIQPPHAEDDGQMDIDGFARNGASRVVEDRARSMTPYENLLWSLWLPRVRSAINNSWTPYDPDPVIALLASWMPILPQFIQDNILDQLVLPKVSQAIAEWVAPKRKSKAVSRVALHEIFLPWMGILDQDDQRMEGLVEEAKRKMKASLKVWRVRDGVPASLDVWKKIFSESEWDSLLLKQILPQLGIALREDFEVNPAKPDVSTLDGVVEWAGLLRPSMMGQLLEELFFPKWLNALYKWLTHNPNLREVADWYEWWTKSYFDKDILAMAPVQRGFQKGAAMLSQASVGARIAPPDTRPTPSEASLKPKSKSTAIKGQVGPATELPDITFRDVVAEIAANNNLVFQATKTSHPRTGKALFQVSRDVDGKGGVIFYLSDEIVWAQRGGGGDQWDPISVDDLILRAGKGGKP